EDHYYSYGLKIASISSKSISSSLNTKMPHYGYQGVFSEEVSEFELNYNEFALRTYDPQIGRWTTPDPYNEFASPYLGMGNDPANNVDPDGGSIFGAIWSFFGGGVSSSTASALTQVSCAGGAGVTAAASTFVTAIRITTVSLAIGGSAHFHFASQAADGIRSVQQGFIGSSPAQNGGAESGGGVSEPGDGIDQDLNNNITANTGNKDKIIGHGPNPGNPDVNEETLPSPRIVIYYVFEAVTPQTYQHIKDATTPAFNNGMPKPLLLTYDGDPARKEERRKNNLTRSGLKSMPDPWRDEYPFACTFEGRNASVKYVPMWEQRIQALELSAVTKGLYTGDKIQVILIPKLPPPVRAPILRPKDVYKWTPSPVPVLSPETVKTGAKIALGAAILYGLWWGLKFATAPATGGATLAIPF
ncbi:MAG TPA: NucA/NucB deoxyribonuclease domain-containing protein, partial [Chitinophagaceae bacterium]|nr:NucA/NucB deoxyribonuclease domain-containing protein [Chitinophagaceae bacterium]